MQDSACKVQNTHKTKKMRFVWCNNWKLCDIPHILNNNTNFTAFKTYFKMKNHIWCHINCVFKLHRSDKNLTFFEFHNIWPLSFFACVFIIKKWTTVNIHKYFFTLNVGSKKKAQPENKVKQRFRGFPRKGYFYFNC